jgi:hypothetical protein
MMAGDGKRRFDAVVLDRPRRSVRCVFDYPVAPPQPVLLELVRVFPKVMKEPGPARRLGIEPRVSSKRCCKLADGEEVVAKRLPSAIRPC